MSSTPAERKLLKNVFQAWWNSLGLRIAKAYAQELQVGPGSTLEISMEAGVLMCMPSSVVELNALLTMVNPNNTITN